MFELKEKLAVVEGKHIQLSKQNEKYTRKIEILEGKNQVVKLKFEKL